MIPRLGRAENDEGIEVFGRAEGVHSEARRRWDAGGGYLPHQATYFIWKKRYDGLLPTQVARSFMPAAPFFGLVALGAHVEAVLFCSCQKLSRGGAPQNERGRQLAASRFCISRNARGRRDRASIRRNTANLALANKEQARARLRLGRNNRFGDSRHMARDENRGRNHRRPIPSSVMRYRRYCWRAAWLPRSKRQAQQRPNPT